MTKERKEIELNELVGSIIAGDSHAEETVVRCYKEGISIIIGRIVQNQSATEDISQETFRIALEKIRLGDVREPERLSGFICGVARNLARDYARRMRRLTNREEIGKAEQIADSAPSQLERVYQKERAELIRQALNELTVKRDREIIFRYYLAQEDKGQICADLGLTRKQFSRVIFRALSRYKELLVRFQGRL